MKKLIKFSLNFEKTIEKQKFFYKTWENNLLKVLDKTM